VGAQYYLSNVRNQLRMPAYLRTDVRVNKSWTKDKWKLTLFGGNSSGGEGPLGEQRRRSGAATMAA
jgi:hypothetical protein